jgi:putative oxidoreductase
VLRALSGPMREMQIIEPARYPLHRTFGSLKSRRSKRMDHSIQSVLAKLSTAEWIPVTAARVLTGVFFCISGGTKLLVPSQFSEMQQTLIQSHIPFPHASAVVVSLVEFACGGGLIFGLLTPLCAVMLMGDMIVAILANRIGGIHASGFLAFLDDFLYLPEVLYVLILFWLLFSGPGPYSVDYMMARGGRYRRR